ncbi:MAG: 16S rRNA (cytosine(1402)-N(4))-methyltransferase RsmH [Deltaproteobacteria bacterium]|nr:16S rRNA (cytosine(1402)-N(4))-methyltransferase RsmH [Deltaproteobacteria bacterium]
MVNKDFQHQSVLVEESIEALSLRKGDIVVDCTAGGGGHAEKIWERIAPNGLLVCIDRDPTAIEYLQTRFSSLIEEKKVVVIKNRFSQLETISKMLNISGRVGAILADLGVSSVQLDQGERGFSFLKDAPLDMRMDPSSHAQSAADVLASLDEKELAAIFFKLGEETQARQIARAIVREREKNPIKTTQQLVNIVTAVKGVQKKKKHPATLVFQALRIFVNEELEELQALLTHSFSVLKPHGRLAIISFQSLEDRIVKTFFKEKSDKLSNNMNLKYLPVREDDIILRAEGRIIKPFPLLPENEEIISNKRSRSAKLRVIEKLGTNEPKT